MNDLTTKLTLLANMAPPSSTVEIFLSLFSPDELLRFIRSLPDGANLVHGLPSPEPFARFVHEAINLFERSKIFDDPAFWEALIRVCPHRRPDIERLRFLYVTKPGTRVGIYLEWLKAQPMGLDLIGVGGGDVKLDLAEVYIPLKVASHDEGMPLRSKRTQIPHLEAREDFELIELFSRLGECPHALLLGQPGSGKTTALRKLSQQCAYDAAALKLSYEHLPIFIRLRRFVHSDLANPLLAFVKRELREVSGEQLTSESIEALWSQTRPLLLLDGLDEIADIDLRTRLCRYLATQLDSKDNQRIRIVVSSRFAGHDGVHVRLDQRFSRCELRPLNATQVRSLIHRWFGEASRCLPRYTQGDALTQAEHLIRALEDPRFGLGGKDERPRMQVMFSTPLLLTLLCVVVQQGREMPRNRSAFYEECLRVMVQRWREAFMQPLLDTNLTLDLLRPLAYELHEAELREEVSEDDLINHLDLRLEALGRRTPDPITTLDWLIRGTGVITEFAPRQYGFFHLGIQEYLAALHIARSDEKLLDILVENFDKSWWHEVARLLVSMPTPPLFAPLMRRLLKTDALIEQNSVLKDCVMEAAAVDVDPFVERLDAGQLEPPARKIELLRLMQGRTEPQLLACAKRIEDNKDEDENVRAMAAQVFAAASRLGSEDEFAFDVACLSTDMDLAQATTLAARLRARGLRVWPGEGPLESVRSVSLMRMQPAIRSAVIVRGAGCPWAERPPLIRILARHRELIGVLLPGSSGRPTEADLQGIPWIRLDDEKGSDGINELCRLLRPAGPRPPSEGTMWADPLTAMRFVYVPPGRFKMGSSRGPEDEQPAHWVRMSKFWLGETPVTNRHYAKFLEARRGPEPRYWRDARFSDPDFPVVGISFLEAQSFCLWLASESGVNICIPSEAQWEYAARGPDGRPFPWGWAPPDGTRACFAGSGAAAPTRVGSYPAGRGPFGALDQAGNVWEWCEDDWDEHAYHLRDPDILDPVHRLNVAEARVLRGGCWYHDAEALSAAFRFADRPRLRNGFIGFRVAMVPRARS